MAYHNLIILMHHPFIDVCCTDDISCRDGPEAALTRKSRIHCTNSSRIVTRLIKTLEAHYRFSCIPFPVDHYILTTATIHIINMDSDDPSITCDAAEGLRTCPGESRPELSR